MWIAQNYNKAGVTLILSPTDLYCIWIAPIKKNNTFILNAWQHTTLDQSEFTYSILFNPTKLGTYINQFLQKNQLRNAYISCAISGPLVTENIVNMPLASPKPKDFPFPTLKKLVWDYRYLYPKENGYYAFYLSGVPRTLIFQHQLLAITHKLNLVTLTTRRMALLNLYQYSKGNSFRHAQLAHDMTRNDNKIEELFSIETLYRLITVPPEQRSHTTDHHTALATALGLFIMEKEK